MHRPAGSLLESVAVSPGEDRIGWAIYSVTQSPIHIWLRRFVPAIGDGAQPRASIWVTSRNGSNCREIGSVAVDLVTDFNRPANLADLRWTLNGRRLLFLHGGALWTVAAD